MNILDTFLFMFEADASKVQKGMETGEVASKNLKKSIDEADLSADKLAANFVKMAKNAAGALAGVLALGAIKTLVNDTAALTATVAMQARAMGMNVEQMSAYQNAIVATGGTAAGATETLGKLRDKFVEMSRFGVMVGPDAFMFRQLGLSAKEMHDSIKDPTIALGALADKFQTLNGTQQLYIGKKLGLDQGTIMLLSQGRRAFDEMIAKQKELGAVTEQQAAASMKYKLAQAELGLTFETVKREIVTQLLPAFTWVVHGIDTAVQFMRQHKGFTIAFFAGIGAAIAVVLVPPLVVAAAAMWAFIAPIIAAAAPFIALGVVIGLIVDDIENFRAGNKSLIGEILDKWPAIGQIARAIGEIVKMSFDLIVSSLKWFGSYVKGEASQVWDEYKKSWSTMFDALFKAFPMLKDVAKAFTDGFKFEMEGLTLVWKTLLGYVDDLWDKIKNAPAAVLNWIGKGLAAVTGGHYDAITGNPDVAPKAPATSATTGKAVNSAGGKEIAAKLVATGKWTPAQAAGIAGSFMQESQGKADARNPTSGAYGLGQWLGSRRKDFEQFSGKALEGSSLDDQISFFNYETDHKEKRAGDMIRKSQTASEAATAHAKYYERPGANEINLERRQQYANMIESGQTQVASTNTPLASQSSQSIANTTNRGGDRHYQVAVAGSTIHTAATDPQAIADAHAGMLTKHLNDALDAHDDGVLI